jgi:hypothetical protein
VSWKDWYNWTPKLKFTQPSIKQVFAIYLMHASDDHEAWTSVQTIADYSGLSRRTIQRAIDALEDSGHLVLVSAAGIRHRTPTYRVCPSASMGVTLTPAEATERGVTMTQEGCHHDAKGVSPRHPNCRKGNGRGENTSSSQLILALDGEEVQIRKCWNTYLETFEKYDGFVRNRKNLAILKDSLSHLAKMAGTPEAVYQLFEIAMERAKEDPWVAGKKDGKKHDSPHAVLGWENIQQWLGED